MIRLTEYMPAEVQLSRAELDHLLPFVRRTPEDPTPRLFETITPTGEPDTYEVRPGPFVGRLGLPSGRWIDFQSRFRFDDLIQLIRLSAHPPLRQDLLRAPAGEDAFLLDVIAGAFAREVQRLVAMGLGKGYVARRFLRPPYPGKLDVNFHLAQLSGREDHLATLAKRLTIDVPINRALGVALEVLSWVPLEEGVTRRLSRLAPAFSRVSRPPMSADDVARIPLTRLTIGYRDALSLAEIILRSRALAPAGIEATGASIVFYMPKVWEASVARWVGEAWGPEYQVQTGYGFDLTEGGEMTSIADVVVRARGRVVALYDAKYKSPEKAPSAGDMYQMVTYCERLRLDEATLVYPSFVEPRVLRIGSRLVRVVGLRFPGFDAAEAYRQLRIPQTTRPLSIRAFSLDDARASPQDS